MTLQGELQQVDARSRRSMQGELEPDPRRGSISSVASGQENGPSNSQRKKGTADLKTAMLHQVMIVSLQTPACISLSILLSSTCRPYQQELAGDQS